MQTATNLRHVPVAEIEDPLLGALLDEGQVGHLVESIGEVGLIHPVTLEEITDGWRLRAGRHRLEAVRRRGESHVPAIVLPEGTDPAVAEMVTIDENLRRRRLSDLEETQALARRRLLYERLHPEAAAKPGRPKKGQKKAAGFAEATAEQTGRSRRSVERDAALGKRIDPTAAENLRKAGHPITHNKSELAKLAELPPKRQREVAIDLARGKLQRVPGEARDQVSGVRCQETKGKGKRKVEASSEADPFWPQFEEELEAWIDGDAARMAIALARLENLLERMAAVA